ncbi:MAG: alpha/beta hydrolase [Bacteroidetes bacterium]|nr:MAG: alpha/beta hydrolase [Bacteroidota bacterium]
MTEKSIEISIQAPYYTYGELTPDTRSLWVVCHGYGQLARHFIRRFDVLDPARHYVIAPQGLSKYYLPGHQRVGASWMTKENRLVEIANYLHYLDAVFEEETQAVSLEGKQLVLMGFSQGVATIGRWAAYRRVPFDRLILWAGGFPHELKAGQFPPLKSGAEIVAVVGNEDEYLDSPKVEQQLAFVQQVTGLKPRLITFAGKHEVKREVLREVAG